MRTVLPWLAAVLALAACDRFDAGVQAYESDRFDEAFAAFAATEARAGQSASAALLHNRALAALRVGQVRDAEFSAEKAVARGGLELAPFRDFVRGNAAFVRCLRAEAEANLEDPDPTALGRAIHHAETARDAWTRVLEGGSDRPAARRNLERCLGKLDELRRRKEEEDRRRRTESVPPPPEPAPPPDEEDPGEQLDERAPPPQADPDVLDRTQLERLLERLAEKEAEKRALRAEQRAAMGARVERDW